MLWHCFWNLPIWSESASKQAGLSSDGVVGLTVLTMLGMIVCLVCAGTRVWAIIERDVTPRRGTFEIMGILMFFPFAQFNVIIFLGLALVWLILTGIGCFISNDVRNPWTPKVGIDAWKQARQMKADNRSLSQSYAPNENLGNRSISRI